MKTIYRSIAVLVLAALAVVSVAAECSDAEKMSLEKMDKAWGDAIQKRDRAALDGMLSPNYSAFTLATATDRKDAMAVMDQPAPAPNNNINISDHYIIRCSANTAVMTHRNEFQAIEDGKGEVFYSRSVHVFEKVGGKWMVLSSVNHPMNEEGNLMYMTYSGLNAFKKKDLEWFEARTHDDAVSIDPDGKVSGKSAMLEGMKNNGGNMESLEIESINARVTRNTGMVVVTYMAKGKAANGTDFSGRYQILRNFIRENGKWMMMSSNATKLADAQ